MDNSLDTLLLNKKIEKILDHSRYVNTDDLLRAILVELITKNNTTDKEIISILSDIKNRLKLIEEKINNI